MGRAMLLFVILMTTIFASVLTTVYRNVGGVPEVLIKNELNKEIENVSDFVLRNAVREAGSPEMLEYFLTGQGGEAVTPGQLTGDMNFIQNFAPGERRYGNCDVESITYSYSMSHNHYKVQTKIRGEMQGIVVTREAEMAFSYPMLVEGKITPNIVYLEFEQVMMLPWLRKLFGLKNNFPDSTENNYNGEFHGFSFLTPTGIDQTKLDEETGSWGGVYNKRFIKYNGLDNYVTIDRKPQSEIDTGVLDMDTNDAFSLMTFAKIDKNGRNSASGFLGLIGGTPDVRKQQGTLMWIPTDPFNKEWALNKPAAAIWFKTTNVGQAKGELHFVVTQDAYVKNGKTEYKTLEVVHPYTRTVPVWKRSGNFFTGYYYTIDDSNFNYPWNSYALTYKIVGNKGVLTAFVDGKKVGQNDTGNPVRAYPTTYGMTLGRKDLRYSTPKEPERDEYCHFFGIMDQTGMNDSDLSDVDVGLWHEGVLKSTLVQYIKD